MLSRRRFLGYSALAASTSAISLKSSTLFAATAVAYPTSQTGGMVGYAKEANVTGGWGGETVFVRSLNEFVNAVAGNTKRVVVLANNIKVSQLTKVMLGSNKTIVGSYSYHTLSNIHLRTQAGSANIIFQNIKFAHDQNINANDDIQLYLTEGKGYWIDHCSFVGHAWSANDNSLDKLLYVGAYADYVTLSYCLFQNHKYGVIIGYPQDGAADVKYEGYPKMTICFNYYNNLLVRAPGLFRYGLFHIYNNVIRDYKDGITMHARASFISENNYYTSSVPYSNPITWDKSARGFYDSGSIYLQDGQPIAVNVPNNKVFNVNYTYKKFTANQISTLVPARAGASDQQLNYLL